MIYSFDLSDYEAGQFTATRYPDSYGVGGDWVCVADSDDDAIALAKQASYDEWAAPDTRAHDDFSVEFENSLAVERLLAAEPVRAAGRATTVHDDGTVSYWDVFRQQWHRCPAELIEDRVLASFSAEERGAVRPQDLDDLLAALRARRIPGDDWDSLPTFGGSEIEDTDGVWSWDASRAIVGTCADDIEIVARQDI